MNEAIDASATGTERPTKRPPEAVCAPRTRRKTAAVGKMASAGNAIDEPTRRFPARTRMASGAAFGIPGMRDELGARSAAKKNGRPRLNERDIRQSETRKTGS